MISFNASCTPLGLLGWVLGSFIGDKLPQLANLFVSQDGFVFTHGFGDVSNTAFKGEKDIWLDTSLSCIVSRVVNIHVLSFIHYFTIFLFKKNKLRGKLSPLSFAINMGHRVTCLAWLDIPLMLGLHRPALGGFLVAMHRPNGVEGAINRVGVIGVLLF
jgi:hypothetical protein